MSPAICSFPVGAVVPIPTLSVLVVRYITLVPSINTPTPPVSSDPQVSIPLTVSNAVQVVNDPSENPTAAPEAPVILAVKVTVSEVASPKVVLPLMLALPVTFKDAPETDPVAVTFVEKLPAPTTSKATVGAVVPIPRRLENEAVPAVKIC